MRGRATTGYYRKWEFLDVRCMTSTLRSLSPTHRVGIPLIASRSLRSNFRDRGSQRRSGVIGASIRL